MAGPHPRETRTARLCDNRAFSDSGESGAPERISQTQCFDECRSSSNFLNFNAFQNWCYPTGNCVVCRSCTVALYRRGQTSSRRSNGTMAKIAASMRTQSFPEPFGPDPNVPSSIRSELSHRERCIALPEASHASTCRTAPECLFSSRPRCFR